MPRYWRDELRDPYRFGPPIEESSLSDKMRELMEIKRAMTQAMADEELLLKAKLDKDNLKKIRRKMDGIQS